MGRPVTPQLTADVIIEMPLLENKPIILIERKFEPFGWAIPGGFVEDPRAIFLPKFVTVGK